MAPLRIWALRPLLCLSMLFLGLVAEDSPTPLDADAVKALELTLADATAAAQRLRPGDETSLKMASVQSDMFVIMIEKIRKMDPRVLDARRADIDAITANLVNPVTEYRQRIDSQEKARWAGINDRIRKEQEQAAAEKANRDAQLKAVAEAEARQRAERAAAEAAELAKVAEQEKAERARIAQSLGFARSSLGICRVASDLMAQRITLDVVKSALFFPLASERFAVTGVVEGYAIYTTEGRDPPMQIAVVKKDGVFYGNGSPLGPDRLRFIEIKTFTTTAMGNRDLLVFAPAESQALP
jgi:hypothetical protein